MKTTVSPSKESHFHCQDVARLNPALLEVLYGSIFAWADNLQINLLFVI